jgi:heptosyltransferase II
MAADEKEIRSAVIIDPAFLGDVVFDGPLVRALREQNPNCKIGLVVRPPADAIAKAMPGVTKVHVFDKKRKDKGWAGLRRLAAELAAENYEVALIPHPSIRSTLLAYLSKIPDRRGTTKGFLAKLFLTKNYPEKSTDTFITQRLRLLAPNPSEISLEGTLDFSKTKLSPKIPYASNDQAEIHSTGKMNSPHAPPGEILSRSSKPKVGLVLGSQWPTKRWSPERAAEFVRGFDRTRADLILIGAEDERPLFDALGPIEGAVDAIGGTVDDLLATIAACDVLIAGDTGPLHIARAFGIPVIALFGPTPETKHHFEPTDHLLTVDLSCRPCSPHGDRTCPEGHHRCMRDLQATRVLAALHKTLDGARR